MACATPADRLLMLTESFSKQLHVRASFNDVAMNIIPTEEFPGGTGYTQYTVEIGRSEPTDDEESWVEIPTIGDSYPTGACNITYNAIDVGFHQAAYEPAAFGLSGPVICQDELFANFESQAFWEKYFAAMLKRSKRSVVNRKLNVYMQYVPKHPCNSGLIEHAGNTSTQAPSSTVDLTDFTDHNDLPQSELTQEMLDSIAQILMEEGATDPDSNGWITLGDSGPEFPLYIGPWASKRLALNSSELRGDLNAAYASLKEANPVLQRVGAKRVIGNFRHVINLFPPRWKITGGLFVRVPTWVMSTTASKVTKGKMAFINPDWRDPSIAAYEGVIVLNPSVMTERVLRPGITSVSGATFSPKNYYGEWKFVTGNDAFLGLDSCTGIADPLHKQGRHFGEYRSAFEPVFPTFGRLLVFKRCSESYDEITCT